ncbi:MAG TPA: 4,5-dihydroxyphthalate decarboxylase [Casimicrobiaceae bacterium]|nr:4,5-dihydroxyphthalate decarboxylase [Casimicrobiaceae bacterium]
MTRLQRSAALLAKIQLSLAIGAYDHVRDLLDGTVPVAGVELTVLRLPVEEMFYRFLMHAEFDVSEASLGKIVAFAALDDRRFVPLPVFPSRVFRHSSIYIRSGGDIARPEDLAGKRVGVPEWAQTAAIYTRGLLAHEYGVDLASIHWHQAGVNEPGRIEKVKLSLPSGVRLTVVAERSLSEMLLAGDLDAVLSARPPAPIRAGDPRMRRLFVDPRAVELAYARKTGIFPIMHVVAMRREVYERDRWLAMNLFKAFEEAKARSLERVADRAVSFFPLPWAPDELRLARELLGDDPWPYGIEPNRTTLETFLRYAFEQGVCSRPLTLETLFPPEVQSTFRI